VARRREKEHLDSRASSAASPHNMATYANGDVYEDGFEVEEEYDENAITSEDCWQVIEAFFRDKGLVSQQLDSFDEFASTTLQEIIGETGAIMIDQQVPEDEDDGMGAPIVKRRFQIEFGSVTISQGSVTEADGSTRPIYPHEARLRNLTYASPMFVEITKKVQIAREKPLGAYWSSEDRAFIPPPDWE